MGGLILLTLVAGFYARHDDITAACTALAGEGQLREVVARRWFALPDTEE